MPAPAIKHNPPLPETGGVVLVKDGIYSFNELNRMEPAHLLSGEAVGMSHIKTCSTDVEPA